MFDRCVRGRGGEGRIAGSNFDGAYQVALCQMTCSC